MRANRVRKCALLATWQTCVAMAQPNAPIGLLRGDLMAWAGTARSGELTFRNAENQMYRCSFDARTYFERANQRITLGALQQGDHLEIVADHVDNTGRCYARTIQVSDAPLARTLPGQRPRLRTSTGPTEVFAPRGDLTFSGIVLQVDRGSLILRTRSNEHKTIHLRPDTRFVSAGQALERGNLEVSTRVFIRAGRNMEGQIEAYQVVWGDILEP